ncbi:hypothetical protein DMB68_17970 [Flavobacterium hydrophilum]|uniref:Uncharacterized protein n=1 Tax=Flavobacterium hydrophilum TaxID=2211445 RepID=A0A2V4BZ53_9FLAO|nr:hypothetical protein DMB68_17970 [Flavobacterium hydrophilum]
MNFFFSKFSIAFSLKLIASFFIGDLLTVIIVSSLQEKRKRKIMKQKNGDRSIKLTFPEFNNKL